MTPSSSILIYGHDAMLLETRRLVLETARFKVTTTSALPAVMTAFARETPGLLILCHTLTRDERGAVMAAAAANRPPVKTLSFCLRRPASGEDGAADDCVESFAGAEGLIAAARRVMS